MGILSSRIAWNGILVFPNGSPFLTWILITTKQYSFTQLLIGIKWHQVRWITTQNKYSQKKHNMGVKDFESLYWEVCVFSSLALRMKEAERARKLSLVQQGGGWCNTNQPVTKMKKVSWMDAYPLLRFIKQILLTYRLEILRILLIFEDLIRNSFFFLHI